jgi:hypothetical protein
MVSKSDMPLKTSKLGRFTVTEICIVVVLIGVIAAAVVGTPRPPFIQGHSSAQHVCISNLRLIDGAKRQWALEFHKQYTDTPARSDLQPYMGRGQGGEFPVCPNDSNQTFDSSYSPNNVGTIPTCKIVPANHVLR